MWTNLALPNEHPGPMIVDIECLRSIGLQFLRSNLVVQFSVVSFVVMALIAVVSGAVLSNKIRIDAINDLVAEAVGSSSARVLRALTPEDLSNPVIDEGYKRFSQSSIVSERTARIKLQAADGTVIYSNDPTEVGSQFPGQENLMKALQGENPLDIKIPQNPKNELERHHLTLMGGLRPHSIPGRDEASRFIRDQAVLRTHGRPHQHNPPLAFHRDRIGIWDLVRIASFHRMGRLADDKTAANPTGGVGHRARNQGPSRHCGT